MALGSKTSSNTTYLTIIDGTLRRKTDSPGEGVLTRTNKQGKEVHEIPYDFVSGEVVSVKIEETDFGDQIRIVLRDDTLYSVSLSVESRYGKDFLMKFPNLTLGKLKISPYDFMDNDKRFSGLTLWQNDEKLKRRFTRDHPNGLPEMVEKAKGNKTVWDDTDQVNFLYQEFEKHATTINRTEVGVVDSKEAPEEEVVTDDLPF